MESQFGEKIRELREKQNLHLRQVAPLLEMDTAQLSKIEKGLRQIKREYIPVIAEVLQADKDELLTLWLADQLYEVVKGESSSDLKFLYRYRHVKEALGNTIGNILEAEGLVEDHKTIPHVSKKGGGINRISLANILS